MRQALARGPYLMALILMASSLAPISGCGGGASDGQAVQVDPDVVKQNRERGGQIRKDMEAKYQKKQGGR